MSRLRKVFDKVRSIKNIELYVALGVALLVLIIVFATSSQGSSPKKSVADESYITQMENKIVNVVERISGCGKATVAISYDVKDEKVYAYNTETLANGDVVSSVVLVKGEPLVLKTLSPNILGVVVVAEGANDPVIKFKIIEVVVTLLDVDANCVQVFTYKS